MKQISLKLKLVTASLLALLMMFLPATPVLADCPTGASVKDSLTCGANNAAGTSGGDSASTLTDTAVNLINVLSLIVGAVAVVMIIVAGVRFVSSAGNEAAVKSAKTTLVFAVIGLVVVAVAQIVVHFVLDNTTKATTGTTTTTTTSQGVCTRITGTDYKWVGGPNDGEPCTP
jgi:heme/copper-type cytochrome/quinol oxidase subunit 2